MRVGVIRGMTGGLEEEFPMVVWRYVGTWGGGVYFGCLDGESDGCFCSDHIDVGGVGFSV